MTRVKWGPVLLLIIVLLVVWGLLPLTEPFPGTRNAAQPSGVATATPQRPVVPFVATPTATLEAPQQEEAAETHDDAPADPSYGLVTEAPDDIRVCVNLGRPTRHQDVAKNFATEAWRDDERTDPVAEAVRTPYKTLFQDPLMRNYGKQKRELWPRVEDLPEKEKIDRLKAEGFYDQSQALVANLYPRMEQFNQLLRRSHHLVVLARVAALRPDAVAALRPYCHKVEKSLLVKGKIDVWGERKALMKLLWQVGVKPAEVGFDPDLYPTFDYGWYWDDGTWVQVQYQQGIPVKPKKSES